MADNIMKNLLLKYSAIHILLIGNMLAAVLLLVLPKHYGETVFLIATVFFVFQLLLTLGQKGVNESLSEKPPEDPPADDANILQKLWHNYPLPSGILVMLASLVLLYYIPTLFSFLAIIIAIRMLMMLPLSLGMTALLVQAFTLALLYLFPAIFGVIAIVFMGLFLVSDDTKRAYIMRRILLMVPTMFGIMVLTFTIIQFAPGGPVEQVLAKLSGQNTDATSKIGGGQGADFANNNQAGGNGGSGSSYRGAAGLDPEFIKKLEKQFGYDKPAYVRFYKTIKDYSWLEFGNSYFRDTKVIELIKEKMPVSISLGLWVMLLSYGISIPLGIRKAVNDGTTFDVWSSGLIIIGYAIPGFLFAVLLIILFAGGSFLDLFPLRDITTSSWDQLPSFIQGAYPRDQIDPNANPWDYMAWPYKMVDYFWHMTLPIIAMSVGAFATTTFLTKNSFLDEIKKQYVTTARAKGLTENQVLYGHVFRNAMLIIIAGFPGAFIGALFANSLLIESIFSLDGLGLLSFESVVNRDYPVVFANLFIFSLLGLVVSLISDLTYSWVDPRIDFETREV